MFLKLISLNKVLFFKSVVFLFALCAGVADRAYSISGELRTSLCTQIYLNGGVMSYEVMSQLENALGEEYQLWRSRERLTIGRSVYDALARELRKIPEGSPIAWIEVYQQVQRDLFLPAVSPSTSAASHGSSTGCGASPTDPALSETERGAEAQSSALSACGGGETRAEAPALAWQVKSREPRIPDSQPYIERVAARQMELVRKGLASPKSVPDVGAIPAWVRFFEDLMWEAKAAQECAQTSRPGGQGGLRSYGSAFDLSGGGGVYSGFSGGYYGGSGGYSMGRYSGAAVRARFMEPDLMLGASSPGLSSPYLRKHTSVFTVQEPDAELAALFASASVLDQNLARARMQERRSSYEIYAAHPLRDLPVVRRKETPSIAVHSSSVAGFLEKLTPVSSQGSSLGGGRASSASGGSDPVGATPVEKVEKVGSFLKLLDHPAVEVGFAESIGKFRPTMEDAHVAQWFEGEENPLAAQGVTQWGVLGVFDGHGSNRDLANDWISKQAAILLPQVMSEFLTLLTAEQIRDPEVIGRTLQNAFSEESQHGDVPQADAKGRLSLQQRLSAFCDSLGYRDRKVCRGMGTTAVVAVILDHDVYVANVGDSRAIHVSPLGVGTRWSWDHNPDDSSELLRVVRRGGHVIPDFLGGVARIQGGLAMSRSLGDWDFEPHLSHTPDVTHFSLDKTPTLALILECDGVHNFYPLDTDAATIVHANLEKGNGAEVAALHLGLHAFESQTAETGGDNITTMVVRFRQLRSKL